MNGIARTFLLATLAGWVMVGPSEIWAASKTPAAPASKKHVIAQNPYLGAIVVDAATGNVLFQERAFIAGGKLFGIIDFNTSFFIVYRTE